MATWLGAGWPPVSFLVQHGRGPGCSILFGEYTELIARG